MEWLASSGKTETPKLLYRASRDGWDASDFHRICNDKGATVTVVKSSDGYIFGGYTDVAWGMMENGSPLMHRFCLAWRIMRVKVQ